MMCSKFLCSLFMECRPGKRKSRRHGEDSSTTKAAGWNSFWGSSQPEQHSVSCFFIGCQGASFISHWLKASFQILQENKGFAWLTWSWTVTKRALYKGLFTPFHTPPLSVFAASTLHLFYIHLWMTYVHCRQNHTTQTVICLLTGNSLCLFVQSSQGPQRNWVHRLDVLHDVQTLTRCNLRVTQLALTPQAFSCSEGVSGPNATSSVCFVLH